MESSSDQQNGSTPAPTIVAENSAAPATRPNGVVHVKAEYLCSAPRQQAAPTSATATGEAGGDADKQRGQNKGSARAHVKYEGSGDRPSFEGEKNFLDGAVLTRAKCILRPVWLKRQRDEPVDDFARAIAEGIASAAADEKRAARAAESSAAVSAPAVETTATEVTPAPAEVNPLSNLEKVVPLSAAEMVTCAAAEAPVSTAAGEVAVPAAAADDDDPELIAIRNKRKEEVAAMVMPEKTTEDQKRDNAAKRDGLFRNKLVLAPLTTVGNLPYRRICAEYGADVTLSEMALIFNLNKIQKSEWSLLRRHESEGLFGIQVAVSRPGDATLFAKALETTGFEYDYIDLNCGCPVDLIVKSGCGCGLWEKKGKLRDVVSNLVNFQSKPVAIKCRIGADENDPQLHKQIAEYESWGASAVTIHGRSRKQRYTKLANWSYIDECSRLTNLPVIGNGDIMGYDDITQHKKDAPNVTSHMIGRGALIKPWAFKEIKEQTVSDPSSSERYEMMQKFCKYGMAHWGADEKGVQTTRKFLLEWLSFLHRYVPTGLVEPEHPQRINERPPAYRGRDELETLMASENVADWIKISEMLLGPCGDRFRFTPKHKSSSYSTTLTGAPLASAEVDNGAMDEG